MKAKVSVAGFGGMLLLLVATTIGVASIVGGGSSIATAPTVVPGQQEFGDSGDRSFQRSCTRKGSYWKIALVAGDHVTIDWEANQNFVGALNVYPVGTTDFNITSTQTIFGFGIGANGKAESAFVANKTGTYPLVFSTTGCGTQTGPFDFVAYVHHQTVLFVRAVGSIPHHLARLSVSVRTPDGHPITDPSLKVSLVGIWSGKWHNLGSRPASQGGVVLSFSVPSSLKGQSIRLRVTATGPSYLTTQTSRTVRVR
jgi:hypothetical protein